MSTANKFHTANFIYAAVAVSTLNPIKCKKTYQFTTPCRSDDVTHTKQHKSFFSGIM